MWQEHLDATKYEVAYTVTDELDEEAREGFLPPSNTPLPLSQNYIRLARERSLPKAIHMPREYRVVSVVRVKDTRALYRVGIRFQWSGKRVAKGKQVDLVVILEGDYEVVT